MNASDAVHNALHDEFHEFFLRYAPIRRMVVLKEIADATLYFVPISCSSLPAGFWNVRLIRSGCAVVRRSAGRVPRRRRLIPQWLDVLFRRGAFQRPVSSTGWMFFSLSGFLGS